MGVRRVQKGHTRAGHNCLLMCGERPLTDNRWSRFQDFPAHGQLQRRWHPRQVQARCSQSHSQQGPLAAARCPGGEVGAVWRTTRHTTTECLIYPGWEILFVPISQPELSGRDKRGGPFVPSLATGTKGAVSVMWLAHPFIPVGGPFFQFFFSQFFLIQLYFCISIKHVLEFSLSDLH